MARIVDDEYSARVYPIHEMLQLVLCRLIPVCVEPQDGYRARSLAGYGRFDGTLDEPHSFHGVSDASKIVANLVDRCVRPIPERSPALLIRAPSGSLALDIPINSRGGVMPSNVSNRTIDRSVSPHFINVRAVAIALPPRHTPH